MKLNQNMFIGLLILLLSCASSWGQIYRALNLEVIPEMVPSPKITLSLDNMLSGSTNIIYRRILGETGSVWGPALTSLVYPSASYVDTNIVAETLYEYKVYSPAFNGIVYPAVASYAVAGVEAPLVEGRGKIILVVDNTLTNALAAELTLLEQDLTGDGWQVIRHDSPRHGTGTPEDLKAWILAKYNEDTVNTKALFLFGHLPIVKSGYINADGHGYQPHATDLFYGELDGTWTDAGTYTYGTVPNVPDDGIYDHNWIPSLNIELQVGRVDLADMPAWSDNETELMRNYLRKDHLWRHALVTDTRKAIFKTGQGSLNYMERGGLHSLFHTADVIEIADWNPEATTNAYTWGVGFGDYNGANYANVDYKMTFTINFGSHKQLFEKSNNAMRAMLAMPDYGLTCAWGARPAWFIHHMGLGETIGYSAFRTQNNHSGDYSPAGQYDHLKGYTHVNLMGDPTLRMYPVAAPTQLSAITNGPGLVALDWIASSNTTVAGYHIYRATSIDGSFVRQNGALVATTNFVDTTAPAGTNVYMVRAVRLENVPTGSYYNPSQGAFVETFITQGFNPDQDGDGMDDSWENIYFGGTNQTDGAATDDWDGDGVDNLSEFIADTLPDNTNSLLKITNLAKESSGFRISWKGGVEATQYLDRTASLAGTGTVWQTIQTNLPPVNPSADMLDLTGNPAQGFYRVRAGR